MDYNRENAYYRAHCLAHDVVDVFSMVADSALEPKNFVSTSVGMYKNQRSHKLESFLGGNVVFQDNIFQAAFGRNNLGMPFQGLRSNVSSLTAHVIQKFQQENLTPDRIIISAAGVEAHEEFVDVVNEKLASVVLPESGAQRQRAGYTGGEVRNLTEGNNVHVVVAFEGANHANALPLAIAEELLGNTRKLGRIQKNILNKHVFVDGAQSINTNFADSGLFGLKVSGSAAHAKEIVEIAAAELSGLRSASASEVQLAKQTLKGRLNRDWASTWRRLEDRTKSLYYNGSTNENISNSIDAVTPEQVQAAIENALRTPLTFVAHGGEVNGLPSYDKISSRFN